MNYKFEYVGGNVDKCTLAKKDGQICFRYSIDYSHHYIPIVGNIAHITQVTEENKKSFSGSAAWGVIGGMALGGIGALAGILAGGNKKEVLVAIQMKSGENILGTVDGNTFKWLLGVQATPSDIKPIRSFTEKMEEFNQKQEAYIKKQEAYLATLTPEQIEENKKRETRYLLILIGLLLIIIYGIYKLLN